MPRVLRKRKTRRDGWNEHHIKQLMTGITVSQQLAFGVVHKMGSDKLRAAMVPAWQELREELLDEWIAANQFTRPLAFWLCEATEPRQRVTGDQLAEAQDYVREHHSDFRRCYFESLNVRLGAEDTRYNGDDWESEKQYLIRLDLLTDAEQELLAL